MKTVIINHEDETKNLIIGCGTEIKAVYNSIMRASMKGNTEIRSLWVDKAKFHPERVYALEIDEDDYIYVITAETVMRRMLAGGEWYII
jgi:hypothetical protein